MGAETLSYILDEETTGKRENVLSREKASDAFFALFNKLEPAWLDSDTINERLVDYKAALDLFLSPPFIYSLPKQTDRKTWVNSDPEYNNYMCRANMFELPLQLLSLLVSDNCLTEKENGNIQKMISDMKGIFQAKKRNGNVTESEIGSIKNSFLEISELLGSKMKQKS